MGRGLEADHIHLRFLLSQLMSHIQGALIKPSSLHSCNQEREPLYDHMILEAKNGNKGSYLVASHRNTS